VLVNKGGQYTMTALYLHLMKLLQKLSSILLVSIAGIATASSASIPNLEDGKKKPKKDKKSTIDSTASIPTFVIDKDSGQLQDLENTVVEYIEPIEINVFDLVYFDYDEVPVTLDLFNHHLSTKQFEVPMDFNHLVKTQIDYFGTRWQEKLKVMITRSEYFFPLYEQILSEYNMPLEIKYLSVIESGLNPNARSRSGAVGAWQFMPATGREYQLQINSEIDERKSLEKSTRAACEYLSRMHNVYGDWLVALASYNCGPGNVRKAMRLSGSSDFWGMYDFLPRETQNYVPKFIAMTYMMNFYHEYGIMPVPIDASLYQCQKVFCDEGTDFNIVAEKLGLTSDELLDYNPELKVPKMPFRGEGYMLSVPEDRAYLYYENQTEITTISQALKTQAAIEEAARPKVIIHSVRKGECLPIIARHHGVTVSQLKAWNGLKGNTIHPNQKLKIHR
jgi:membrane-bound lytic murein transglycosylase D